MPPIIKKIIRKIFGSPSVILAACYPCKFALLIVRKLFLIQLTIDELSLLVQVIRQTENCRLLIFGLGNDSLFWHLLNRKGRTVFLEDHLEWLDEMRRKHPEFVVLQVSYGTTLAQWRELLDCPELLMMELPEAISSETWDVILVDAPGGYNDHAPGRMKSIFTASRLIQPGGHLFVHDCHREVERIYSDKYLRKFELIEQVGTLRHYHGQSVPV